MPRTRTKEEQTMIDLRRALQEEENEANPIVIDDDDDEDWTEEEMEILHACDS